MNKESNKTITEKFPEVGALSEWRKCKLGEQINLKRGYDLPTRLRQDGSVPIYSSAGISGLHSEKMCEAPGVITGRYGTIGQVFYAKTSYWPLNTALYVQDFKGNDELFVYYFLHQLDWEKYSDKSAVPGINRNNVHQEDIAIPPIPEQKAISSVLSSLDDKIDLLHRQNKTLEAMAETLFRQWFVVEAGEDWEEVLLGDYVSVKHGYAFKGAYISNEPTNLILVTPGNFKIGGGFKFDKFKYYATEDFPKDYIFQAGDLVITMTDLSVNGDTLGYPALIPNNYRNEFYLHNQRVGKVILKNKIGKYFLYYLMKTEDYQWYILSGASGTSIRHTSPSSICSYSFKIAPEAKIFEFENYVTKLVEKNNQNQRQIRTLETLRDTLLPKLMSGEVRVNYN